MMRLVMPAPTYAELLTHLLPPATDDEEAAFGFAQMDVDGSEISFRLTEWTLIPPSGFTTRSPYYLELNDETRGRVIKRAHDLNAALVEFHSHPTGLPQFSWSDKAGLREFVPHVHWRLRGKPYAAVVVAPGGCDALAWLTGPENPTFVNQILAGNQIIQPSGWSFQHWEELADYGSTL